MHFFTHTEVVADPEVPVPEWELSEFGRARAELLSARLSGIGSLWVSPEGKAQQTSRIVGAGIGFEATTVGGLAEMVRSSTGYLPEPEFWATYREFLALPSHSSRGWETAVDAQRRIVGRVDGLLASHTDPATDVAVVSHGGVGALLLCELLGTPIQRLVDQPRQGSHFSFDVDSREVLSGWQIYEDIGKDVGDWPERWPGHRPANRSRLSRSAARPVKRKRHEPSGISSSWGPYLLSGVDFRPSVLRCLLHRLCCLSHRLCH